jgi:hypothetical protein
VIVVGLDPVDRLLIDQLQASIDLERQRPVSSDCRQWSRLAVQSLEPNPFPRSRHRFADALTTNRLRDVVQRARLERAQRLVGVRRDEERNDDSTRRCPKMALR